MDGITYPLVIKVLDFLTEDEVLQQGWTALSGLQTVLIRDGAADISGHVAVAVIEIELGQELLCGRSRIAGILSTLELVRIVHVSAIELARQIRTSNGRGSANQAGEAGQKLHCAHDGGSQA